MGGEKLNICMISDFFCPNTGGVETHIYHLSKCLIQLGHRVVVITHQYGPRRNGVRYLCNGQLKVYYLPFLVFHNGCCLPTVYATFPWIRYVLLREKISVVHGHSSFSTLAHEGMFHAQALGIHTFFTDHSLFGFADASSIVTNKLLRFSLCNCSHVICVSHTSKENTLLRAHIAPAERISVIPNAINSEMFRPEPALKPQDRITVVVVSRLVYRKGMDLLAGLIPPICRAHPDVDFLIAGDGPKRVVLEETREKNRLQERVTLLSSVPHSAVSGVLNRGHIFINVSLTEAFCMAIVEAASCGLLVVSTNVGGIPEVLPHDLILMAEPNVDSLVGALTNAIELQRRSSTFSGSSTRDPLLIHRRVKKMYSWSDVSRRVEKVYREALKTPVPEPGTRLKRSFRCGGFGFGIFFVIITAVNLIVLHLLELFQPAHSIRYAQREEASKITINKTDFSRNFNSLRSRRKVKNNEFSLNEKQMNGLA